MGEYIDKDALLNYLFNKQDEPLDVMKEIAEFAAADVAPVRYGKWYGDTCTICKLPWNWNMTQDADDWGYFDPMPDYCPNCGAKMDGSVGIWD